VETGLKTAFITPRLKKLDLDVTDVRSFRPISNLSVISKLLERLVACRLLRYLTDNNLLPRFQSAYRPNHSTETAVVKVLADILLVIDGGDLAGLALLDLSAAFDTVDHDVLLQRLRLTYGIDDVALTWFRSYQTTVTASNTSDCEQANRRLFRCSPRLGAWPDTIPSLYC